MRARRDGVDRGALSGGPLCGVGPWAHRVRLTVDSLATQIPSPPGIATMRVAARFASGPQDLLTPGLAQHRVRHGMDGLPPVVFVLEALTEFSVRPGLLAVSA